MTGVEIALIFLIAYLAEAPDPFTLSLKGGVKGAVIGGVKHQFKPAVKNPVTGKKEKVREAGSGRTCGRRAERDGTTESPVPSRPASKDATCGPAPPGSLAESPGERTTPASASSAHARGGRPPAPSSVAGLSPAATPTTPW